MRRPLLYILFVLAVILMCGPSHVARSRTSKIVLRFIWLGADFTAPVQKTDITISVAGSRFRKQTSRKGWLVLPNVPCDQNINILLGRNGFIVRNSGESPMRVGANGARSIKRYVPCSDKPVPVGAFYWRDGAFIGTDMDNIDGCRTC